MATKISNDVFLRPMNPHYQFVFIEYFIVCTTRGRVLAANNPVALAQRFYLRGVMFVYSLADTKNPCNVFRQRKNVQRGVAYP